MRVIERAATLEQTLESPTCDLLTAQVEAATDRSCIRDLAGSSVSPLEE